MNNRANFLKKKFSCFLEFKFNKRGDYEHAIEIIMWIAFIALALFGIGFLLKRLGVF